MTTTLTERQAIERMMSYIEEERARLWTSYEGYLNRLRELDDIDRMSEQSDKADAVMAEDYERPLVPQEEVDEANERAREELFKCTKLCNEIEQSDIPVHKEGQSLGEYLTENKDVLPVVEEQKEDKHSNGLEPDKLYMRKSLKRGTTNDNQVVAQFVKVILKEHGMPMKAKKLIEKLEEANIKSNHPHSTVQQAMAYDPRIQKAGFGYYQYV